MNEIPESQLSHLPRMGIDYTAQDIYQLGIIILAVGTTAFTIYRAVQKKFFPIAPGEVVTPNLANYFFKPGRIANAEDVENASHKYDYIIVGGGTAGCVLANRLSEDAEVKVLLIEAGTSDLKHFFTRIPATFTKLFRTAADWDVKTTEQPHLGGRVLDWPRGKMLGGCSAINAMIYNRGAPDDFDEWKRLGNPGWGYSDVRPYFEKSEGFKQGKDRKLKDEELQQHGRNGPWQTGYRTSTAVSNAFVDACATVGIDRIEDFNTHHGMNGAGNLQTFIDERGQRSSTAVSYLTADVVARKNLTISVGQTVTRIIFDTSENQPRAVGVELGGSATTAVRYIAAATKEVILCAGAVHTPQLLGLSGIGNSEDLNALDIPVIKNLPAVGHNLVDHLQVNCIANVTEGSSLQWLSTEWKVLPYLIRWLWDGSGPMSGNVAEAAAFWRFSDRLDAPEALKAQDLSSGPGSSDMEILHCAATHVEHGKISRLAGHSCTGLGAILLRPMSRGSIKLQSSSPFDPPLVDANYLSHSYDAAALVHGVKVIRQLVKSPAYAPYFKSWLVPSRVAHFLGDPRKSMLPKSARIDLDKMSDDEILEFTRETAETIYHPMGTARMGPSGEDAVVDARLRVHGVEGLRVADASVFPTPLACHPCAGVVMVGEKLADMLKEDRKSELEKMESGLEKI